MPIAVDDVCTHAELDEYLGSQLTGQVHLLPASWAGDSSKVRTWALGRVLEALRRRTPPVREGDLADVTELKQAVIHGSAMRLYDLAMTSGADAELFHAKMRAEERRFADELGALQPTTSEGTIAPPRSIGVSRR